MIINVADTSILNRNQLSHKEFRGLVTEWLKDNFQNNSYTNNDTGFNVLINKTCIEKIVNSFGDIKAHAYTAIPLLIVNAIFIKSEDDNRRRPDFIKVLTFKSLIDISGEIYEVWLYVRQTKHNYLLYSVNINAGMPRI